MMTLFDSTKKVLLTRRPSSSSKPTSNYPVQNDKPRGDPDSRYHESPTRKPTTAVYTHAPVAFREKDDVHTQNFQPTRKPMQALPRKETQTIPPESFHVPYHVQQTSTHEFRVLTQEKKRLQSQLLAMQEVLDTALNTSEAWRKETRRLNEELQRLDSIMISMVSADKLAGNKINDLERKVLQRDEHIRNLEQKLRISEEQRSQTTKLLDDRTAELKGAQAFLTTADRYSGADIIKMAESLNAEIFQASALIAELLVDVPPIEDPVKQEKYMQKYEKYLEHGRRVMGSRLFDHLVTKSREIRVDPLPLQLAFQAMFTSWCVYEVNQFCEGPTGKSLKQIYRGIYKCETQAVAGRWRVMTSVQTMNSDTPSGSGYMLHTILSLMLICGWFGSQDASQRAKLSVEQAVLRVEKMWKTLKAAIMQEITAAEIIMFAIGPASDYNPATMDDMYMDASNDVTTNLDNHEHRILCPVGVGLQREVSKRCKDGTMQIDGEVVLKPKIVLSSVLLKGEPSPNTQKEMMLSATDGRE